MNQNLQDGKSDWGEIRNLTKDENMYCLIDLNI